jgi:hypothetical protein
MRRPRTDHARQAAEERRRCGHLEARSTTEGEEDGALTRALRGSLELAGRSAGGPDGFGLVGDRLARDRPIAGSSLVHNHRWIQISTDGPVLLRVHPSFSVSTLRFPAGLRLAAAGCTTGGGRQGHREGPHAAATSARPSTRTSHCKSAREALASFHARSGTGREENAQKASHRNTVAAVDPSLSVCCETMERHRPLARESATSCLPYALFRGPRRQYHVEAVSGSAVSIQRISRQHSAISPQPSLLELIADR